MARSRPGRASQQPRATCDVTHHLPQVGGLRLPRRGRRGCRGADCRTIIIRSPCTTSRFSKSATVSQGLPVYSILDGPFSWRGWVATGLASLSALVALWVPRWLPSSYKRANTLVRFPHAAGSEDSLDMSAAGMLSWISRSLSSTVRCGVVWCGAALSPTAVCHNTGLTRNTNLLNGDRHISIAEPKPNQTKSNQTINQSNMNHPAVADHYRPYDEYLDPLVSPVSPMDTSVRQTHLQILARISPLPVANKLFVGLGATEITAVVRVRPGSDPGNTNLSFCAPAASSARCR